MFFYIIGIVITLIIFYTDQKKKIEKLEEENKILRTMLSFNGIDITTGKKFEKDNFQSNSQSVNLLKEDTIVIKEESAKNKEEEQISEEELLRRKKEEKNVFILISGAFCIILSAIVFLMSTWSTISSLLKTTILVLLTLVFFGGSYIAKEKFKLEKISQTFFYMAMAYIPICLLSISVFKLLGHFLSLYGEGKYIYLMFASLVVSIIYYYTYRNKENNYMLYGSILSQMFTIIAFSLILSNDILLIGICLLLYNIALMLYTKKEIFAKIYNFIPTACSIIAIPMLFSNSKYMVLLLLLLSINFLILEYKKTCDVYSYAFNIFAMLFGVYSINIFVLKEVSLFIILLYIISFFIIQYTLLFKTQRENLLDSGNIITIISLIFLYIFVVFDNTSSIIQPYMVSLVEMGIAIFLYIKNKLSSSKKILASLICISFIISGLNILSLLECSYGFYIIFSLLTYIINELIAKKDKDFYCSSSKIANIFIIIVYAINLITNYKEFSNDIIYSVCLFALYSYNYFIAKKDIYKYASYVTLNLVLFTLFNFVSDNVATLYYVPTIGTLITMAIEMSKKDIEDKFSNTYMVLLEIVSFICMYLSASYVNYELVSILVVFFAMILVVSNLYQDKKTFNILPLTCVIPAIFFTDFKEELKLILMLMSIILTTCITLKDKKISMHTIYSLVYVIFSAFNIDNVYLKEVIFICYALVNYIFMLVGKEKDIFKFLLYLSVMFLYNSIICELNLEIFTFLDMLGYIMVAILTIRTIMVKYTKNEKDLDNYEYIILGLLYLISLFKYTNETDGMLFGCLIVVIIMVSYIKKYGALCMISIFALIVNMLILTREFWFSVPWWAYLLTIGSVLIGFAVKNEISEKKSEINAFNIFKKLKEKIEHKENKEK